MELDLREAAGGPAEPDQGANADMAAEESPSSVGMEYAETDPGAGPDAGPDTGHERKGGGSATLSGDDQGDVSVPGGLDGEFAKIRYMIQESFERMENGTFGKLYSMEAQTKMLAEAVAANTAALREFSGAEGGHPEAGGTAKPRKDENRIFTADFHRWADAQRRYRLRWSALALAVLVPAFFLLGILVQLEFQIIPAHDPSGGWSRHIWEHYGPAIVDCAMEAKRTDRVVKCSLDVRRP